MFFYLLKTNSQTFKKISVEDGLPSSIIYDIKADKFNRIWIATFGGGISCYNGVSFKNINQDDGLHNDLIRCLFLTDTSIYVGSQGGLDVISKDTIKNLNQLLNDSLGSNVLVITQYKNKLYLSTQDGLMEIVNGKRNLIKTKVIAYSITFDAQNNCWLPSRKSILVRLANKQIIEIKDEFNNSIEGASDIKIYKDLVLAATKNGLLVFKNFKLIKRITSDNGFKTSSIKCILVNGNEVWIGTKIGLYRTTDLIKFDYFGPDNGIDKCEIKCLALDNNKLLWVGSSTNGLFKMINCNIVKYPLNTAPIAFAKNNNNQLFALSASDIKFFNVDSNKFVPYLNLKPFNGSWQKILFDKKNNLYLTNGETGFLKISPDGKTKNFEYKINKLDNQSMSMVLQDSFIWLGYKRSFIKYNYYINKVDSFNNKLFKVAYFQDGLVLNNTPYFATGDGLIKIKERTVEYFSHKNVVGFPTGIVNSVLKDKYNHIWIAADRGLFCLEEDKVKSNTRKDGFFTNEIASIAIIDTSLFVATNKGLIQIPIKPKNNQNCIYQVINSKNGLIENDLTNKFIFSEGQYVWIPTETGAYRYKPSNQLKIDIPIFLSNVSHDSVSLVFKKSKNYINEMVDVAKDLKLEHFENDIQIEFCGINHHLFDNVYYTYRLLGYNSNWSLPNTYNKAIYTNLEPNEYVFQLSLSNGKKNIGKILSYNIIISPPFYKTWWFKVMVVTAILLLIYIFVQLRLRSIKIKNALLEKKVDERTKALNQKTEELSYSNLQLSAKNKLITESLEYAQNIQNSILPSETFINEELINRVKVSLFYLPKDIVSGDFYYINKKDNLSYFAIVDCTGHGVPGALLSFSVFSLLHGIIDSITSKKSLQQIVATLNHEFKKVYGVSNNAKESYAISLISYNNETKNVSFFGTSQSVFLFSNNEITEIKSNNTFYEISSEELKEVDLPVNKGDRIYLVSDGYYDQKHFTTKKRMYKLGLKRELEKTKTLSLEQQVVYLKNFYLEFKGSAQQVDDTTFFAIEII